ncbi:DUF7518 family protein [Natranaeroarchaeum aerophilus]|uniref:BZIP transcription factor n=1 Tax=Natranaeroarchaeum aerophilus TaxID=2917711 RepID=A0AAE3FSF5_9EURY|nr:bZIP transcription factor [Natranaeroarchaeum aerophilus]MCL9814326.1 bZIP transcription factor [Natranaeroarchaeum aerophilus]
MSNDRVEELEATVSELESTIRGLTEELVETKERVRMLENEVDPEPAATVGSTGSEESMPAEPEGEAAPEDVQEAAAEADKTDEDNAEDEPDDSGLGDDIIVA